MKTAQQAAHTSGPWKVMGHPLLAGKHVFHESRFITTSDAVVEIYDADPDVRNQNDWDTAWGLRNGVIICETKDSVNQAANARLLALAPELFELVKSYRDQLDEVGMNDGPTFRKLCAIIEKVEGAA